MKKKSETFDRSKQARNQPRNELGQFKEYKHLTKKLVIIDESGDMGYSPKSDDFLILSATVIMDSDADDWRDIATRYDRNTYGHHEDKELKFRSSSYEVRRAVLEEVAGFEPDIRAIAVNKKRLPDDWKRQNGKDPEGKPLYRMTLEKLLDGLMSDIDGNLKVIIDPHQAIEGSVGEKKTIAAAAKNNVAVSEATQKRSSKDELAIQTNDFIPGTIGSKFNQGSFKDYPLIEPYLRIKKVEK